MLLTSVFVHVTHRFNADEFLRRFVQSYQSVSRSHLGMIFGSVYTCEARE